MRTSLKGGQRVAVRRRAPGSGQRTRHLGAFLRRASRWPGGGQPSGLVAVYATAEPPADRYRAVSAQRPSWSIMSGSEAAWPGLSRAEVGRGARPGSPEREVRPRSRVATARVVHRNRQNCGEHHEITCCNRGFHLLSLGWMRDDDTLDDPTTPPHPTIDVRRMAPHPNGQQPGASIRLPRANARDLTASTRPGPAGAGHRCGVLPRSDRRRPDPDRGRRRGDPEWIALASAELARARPSSSAPRPYPRPHGCPERHRRRHRPPRPSRPPSRTPRRRPGAGRPRRRSWTRARWPA